VSRSNGLGPQCIGQRVVVRRIVPGEEGPTGGPAMTDLLGVMESWSDGVTSVRDESGNVTSITIAHIVSGKPVPPRPSVRHRVSAEAAERRAVSGWPPLVKRSLGEWVLRASQGYSSRANSVLAVGDPGLPFTEALSAVVEFYSAHDLPPVAQVVVSSDVHQRFEAAGWVSARPGEADTMFQIASVSRALRLVRQAVPAGALTASMSATAGPRWFADDARAEKRPEALGVLEGPDQVGFAAVIPPGAAGDVLAKGRVAYADDWVGISNVWVSPTHRRLGLAVTVVGAMLAWGAERGATTAYLQTRGDNPAALALYDRLGFVTHHTYRYLTRP